MLTYNFIIHDRFKTQYEVSAIGTLTGGNEIEIQVLSVTALRINAHGFLDRSCSLDKIMAQEAWDNALAWVYMDIRCRFPQLTIKTRG
jgi:hypothetical protein